MANLSNKTASNQTTLLNGPHNYQPWFSDLKRQAKAFGLAGHHLLLPTSPTLLFENPGPPPSELDKRMNPRTGKPTVPLTLLYPREERFFDTADSLDGVKSGKDQEDDDPYERPMTKEGQAKFDSAVKAHYTAKKEHIQETVALRKDDDSLLAYMYSSIDKPTQAVVEMHKDYQLFENRPSTYTNRAKDYYKMVTDLLSTGSNRLTSQNLLTLMSTHQGDTPFAEFMSVFDDRWLSTSQGLEDPLHKGFVSLNKVKFMLLLHVLNRNNPANKQGLNNFFTANPSADPDVAVLISTILAQNLGELAEHPSDPTSVQGSALITAPPKKFVSGTKKPNRTDHCKHCLKSSDGKLYFYHPIAECNRKKRDDAAAAVTKPSSATALLAAPAPTAQEILNATANVLADRLQAADSISMMSNNLSLP